MARKFLTAIDLVKNELQNPAIHNLAAAPSAPVKGQMYFDTVSNVLYWWNGTTWVASSGSTVAYGSVPAETTFGLARADGVATSVARSDHTHGSPLHDNAAHAAVNLSALAVPIANVSWGNFGITNLASPGNPNDAVNKAYVDNAIAGLSWKDSVRVASQGSSQFATTGLFAIDGVTLVAGDRVLLRNQTTTPAENGIWVAASGAWARPADADTGAELVGAAVFVEEGTTMADTAWVNTTNAPITVGTTSTTWVQFAGGGAVTAGGGMTQSGNVLNVVGDASIIVAADSVSRAALTGDVTAAQGSNSTTIANDVVSNAKLSNMAANTIKGNNTGASADPVDMTPAQLAAMSAGYIARKYSTSVGDGAATSFAYTHNFNTRDLAVEVARSTTPWDTVDCDVERTTANSVTLRFAVAPAAAEYMLTILG